MSNSARQQSIWYKLHIDLPLLLGLLTLMSLSMVVLYSASGQDVDSIVRQLVRGGLAFALMIGMAQLPPPSMPAGRCRCSWWWCCCWSRWTCSVISARAPSAGWTSAS